MAHKDVLFRSAAREAILRGTTQLADTVRVTLGPRSKSVLIDLKYGQPLVCNDGVTIAKEFDLKDATENLGVRVLRQAAERTADVVGDGTSSATVLAQAIFADGVRNVVAGASAIDIKRGLDRGALVAIEARKDLSRTVKSPREKAQVATIFAHNGPTIGDLVAEAMHRIGNDGVITVEESKSTETVLDVVEGMQFDRGFQFPYLITNQDKMEAKLEDCLGRARRVVADKDTTTITGGGRDPDKIKARIAQIRTQIDKTTSDYDREKLQERLAKLAGGVAVIRVGAPSESGMKARKDALDDAISATKAAVAEGIVPGVAGLRSCAASRRWKRRPAFAKATNGPDS